MTDGDTPDDGWAHDEAARELERIRDNLGTDAEYDAVRRLPGRTLTASLVLFSRGYTFKEIADMQGYTSPGAARAAIESAIASAGVSESDRDLMRAQSRLIYDQHHMVAFEKAMDQNNPEQGSWMKLDMDILGRKAKLLGLDAPQVHFVNPEGSEFEAMAALLAGANGATPVLEVDPFAVDRPIPQPVEKPVEDETDAG